MYWLKVTMYVLHFSRRKLNILIFSMKVLKLFWEKISWKWKLLCIWLESKIIKHIVILLKLCVTKSLSTWLICLFIWILITKTLEHFFLSFLNENFFPQCQKSFWSRLYLPFLFSVDIAIDFNQIKK